MIETTMFYLTYIVIGFITAYFVTKSVTTRTAVGTWAVILFWPLIVAFIVMTLIIFGPSKLLDKLNEE